MFSEELAKYDWEETTARILSKTAADVERALAKGHPTLDDFMALVSPAAAAYLESLGGEERQILGVTPELAEGMYRDYALADKVYQEIIGDINPEISDDEACFRIEYCPMCGRKLKGGGLDADQ